MAFADLPMDYVDIYIYIMAAMFCVLVRILFLAALTNCSMQAQGE